MKRLFIAMALIVIGSVLLQKPAEPVDYYTLTAKIPYWFEYPSGTVLMASPDSWRVLGYPTVFADTAGNGEELAQAADSNWIHTIGRFSNYDYWAYTSGQTVQLLDDYPALAKAIPPSAMHPDSTYEFYTITINDAFTFPASDGTADQVLVTDGLGNANWATHISDSSWVHATGSTVAVASLSSTQPVIDVITGAFRFTPISATPSSVDGTFFYYSPGNGFRFREGGAWSRITGGAAGGGGLTEEEVEDFAWSAVSDGTGTQTLITVTYQDVTNDVDFVVDNDLGNYDWSSSLFDYFSNVGPMVEATGDVVYYNGTAWINLAAGTEDQVLTIASSGIPFWATYGGGVGTLSTIECSDATIDTDITNLDFLGNDFDVSESPENEANVTIDATLTRDVEWDTTAEINAATTDQDFLTESSVLDALANVAALTEATGDMVYWTGSFWDVLNIGSEDEVLTVNVSGLPNWEANGVGTMSTVEEGDIQLGDADIVTLDFLNADFDVTEVPDTEANIRINAGITRDTEWDSAAEINAATGDEDFLTESSELDALANVAAMVEATGDLVYYNGSAWTRLASGSTNQILTMSGGLPIWAAGGSDSSWVAASAATAGVTTLQPLEAEAVTISHALRFLGTAATPSTSNGTVFYNSAANQWKFRENGAWTTLGGGAGGGSLTEEQVEDYAWSCVSDGTGTQTRITVTYQDDTNDVDFVVDADLSNYTWSAVVDAHIPNILTIASGSSVSTSVLAAAVTRDAEIDTEAELEGFVSDVSDIYTDNDGALDDDDLSDNSVSDLSDMNDAGVGSGALWIYNGGWIDLASGSTGQILGMGASLPEWGADDDVPEAGDFGAANDLDANGDVANDSHTHGSGTITSADGDVCTFDDTDNNFTATNLDDALTELDDVDDACNDGDGMVDWTNLESVPAGFADGVDATGASVGTTKLVFHPEFEGAVIDTFLAHAGNHNGDLTTVLSPDGGAVYYNAYKWTSSEATDQYVGLHKCVTIPQDWNWWHQASAITARYMTGLAATTNNSLTISIYKNGTAAAIAITDELASASWTTVTIPRASISSASWAVDDVMRITYTFKANSTASAEALVGALELFYSQ